MENFDNVLVIDADGHVYEGNVDLTSRMPEKWRSQAPVPLKDKEGNSRIRLQRGRRAASQGMGPGESGPMTEKARGYRAGMVDPAAQLKDMDQEGIDVAILFGTQIALTVNGLMNKELAAVLCHAVNEWLIEYCSADKKRLRSEEHTSELQSLRHLVCRLLLEKKKNSTSPSGENARARMSSSGKMNTTTG